jgi:hypothetical protein
MEMRPPRESDGCAGGQILGIQWKSNFYQNVLRAFAKFQKAAVSFVMSACPSVRMEELCSHWTDFYEI